jgi:putative acetyltransferase
VSRCEIRLLREGESAAVVAVWRRSRDDVQPWLEARMSHTRDDDLRFFRDVLAREYDVWLALDGGEIVGLMAIRDGFIDQLYVDPKAQGRGVGSELLAKAAELSPGKLALYTHQRNARARRFYERRGFRVVAFGLSDPPECEPDVRYER